MRTFTSEMSEQENRLINKYFPVEKVFSIELNKNILRHMRFTGTYILSSDDMILYIGVSINIGSRLLNHLNSKSDFVDKISNIRIIRFLTWEQAEALESFLINKIRPKYNKFNPGGASYYCLEKDSRKDIQLFIDGLVRLSDHTRRLEALESPKP